MIFVTRISGGELIISYCERKVFTMKRIWFWIKNCLIEDNRGCKSFCGTCQYYEQCRMDENKENNMYLMNNPERKGLIGAMKWWLPKYIEYSSKKA